LGIQLGFNMVRLQGAARRWPRYMRNWASRSPPRTKPAPDLSEGPHRDLYYGDLKFAFGTQSLSLEGTRAMQDEGCKRVDYYQYSSVTEHNTQVRLSVLGINVF
jgi:hypothetical protein